MKLNFVIVLLVLLLIIVLLTKHNSKFIGSNVTDSTAGANQNRARILFKYRNPTTFGNGALWNGLILYLEEVSTVTDELRNSQPPLTDIFGAKNIFFNERYSNYYSTYTTNSDLRNKRPNIIKNGSSINALYSTLKDNNQIDDYNSTNVATFATGISNTPSLVSKIPDSTLRNEISRYMANLVLFSSLFKNTQIGIYDEYTDQEYSTPIPFVDTLDSLRSKLRKSSETVYIGTRSNKYVTLDTSVPYYKFGIAIINDKSTIQTPDYLTFPFTISNFYSIIIPANVAGFYSDPISGLSAMIDFF
jgi:hypothetical protein